MAVSATLTRIYSVSGSLPQDQANNRPWTSMGSTPGVIRSLPAWCMATSSLLTAMWSISIAVAVLLVPLASNSERARQSTASLVSLLISLAALLLGSLTGKVRRQQVKRA